MKTTSVGNDRSAGRGMVLATAILPVFAANFCYWLSVSGDYIPRCVVYLDGCTSVSAAGRYGASYWLFKLLMLPQAILLVVFWRYADRRLACVNPRLARRMRIAGWLAALFLVLYLVFLGSSGDLYRLMRRYGVFVFFLGTLVAQIMATRLLARDAKPPMRLVTVQRALLIIMGLLALAEMPLGTFGIANDRAENIIEWNFALLMQLWFLSWLAATRTTGT